MVQPVHNVSKSYYQACHQYINRYEASKHRSIDIRHQKMSCPSKITSLICLIT